MDHSFEVLIAQFGSFDKWNRRTKLSVSEIIKKSILQNNPYLSEIQLINRYPNNVAQPTWTYTDSLNMAAAHAKGSFLLFLHPTIELDSKFFQPMFEALTRAQAPENYFETISAQLQQSAQDYILSRKLSQESNSTIEPPTSPEIPDIQPQYIGMVGAKLELPYGLLYNTGLSFKLHRVSSFLNQLNKDEF